METVNPGAFGEFMTLRGVGNWVAFLIGFALLAVAAREIFKPRLKRIMGGGQFLDEFEREIRFFAVTHPSYV